MGVCVLRCVPMGCSCCQVIHQCLRSRRWGFGVLGSSGPATFTPRPRTVPGAAPGLWRCHSRAHRGRTAEALRGRPHFRVQRRVGPVLRIPFRCGVYARRSYTDRSGASSAPTRRLRTIYPTAAIPLPPAAPGPARQGSFPCDCHFVLVSTCQPPFPPPQPKCWPRQGRLYSIVHCITY